LLNYWFSAGSFIMGCASILFFDIKYLL